MARDRTAPEIDGLVAALRTAVDRRRAAEAQLIGQACVAVLFLILGWTAGAGTASSDTGWFLAGGGGVALLLGALVLVTLRRRRQAGRTIADVRDALRVKGYQVRLDGGDIRLRQGGDGDNTWRPV